MKRWDYFILSLFVLVIFISIAVNLVLLNISWAILGLDKFKQHVYDEDYW